VQTSRDSFLERVRQAVRAGQRAGIGDRPAPRGPIGYQGAGPELVAGFCQAFQAAGGQAHVVPDRAAAVVQVQTIVQARAGRRVVVSGEPLLAALNLPARLHSLDIEVTPVAQLTSADSRDVLFGADLGITGADYLVAETGSIVLLHRPDEPRSASLLPPVHVVVAQRGQIVPDLFDLFAALGTPADSLPGPVLPSCVTIITGPSKTGDIELRLVTGVHGPGEVHCVLIDPPALAASATPA
jgi:L-lactate dehydrogenase complex protein LldG